MSDESPPAEDIPAWLRGPAPLPERYRLDLVVSAEVYGLLAASAAAQGRTVEDVAAELLAEAPTAMHKLAEVLMELATLRAELRRLGHPSFSQEGAQP